MHTSCSNRHCSSIHSRHEVVCHSVVSQLVPAAVPVCACVPLQGLGSVAAALQLVGRLPSHFYVSHNHTDHAGMDTRAQPLACSVPLVKQGFRGVRFRIVLQVQKVLSVPLVLAGGTCQVNHMCSTHVCSGSVSLQW
jgi:hypothetical protein